MTDPIERRSIVGIIEAKAEMLVVDQTLRSDMTQLAYKAQVETARATYTWPSLFMALGLIVAIGVPTGSLIAVATMLPTLLPDPRMRPMVLTVLVVALGGSSFAAPRLLRSMLEHFKSQS